MFGLVVGVEGRLSDWACIAAVESDSVSQVSENRALCECVWHEVVQSHNWM